MAVLGGFLRTGLRQGAQRILGILQRKWRAQSTFDAQLRQFRTLAAGSTSRFPLVDSDLYPCLTDATTATAFDRHYVYHPAWAARVLSRTSPEVHVDISSSLHFATLVSAFIPVKFYDYRPAHLDLPNLTSSRADLLALPFESRSQKSLSCMHTVEHVGLGRYGDPLDYDGDLKAMRELQRVVSPGGTLLFVVPVGKPRIAFNAHRIYSYAQVLAAFPELALQEFALVEDDARGGRFIQSASEADSDRQTYGCGCFWFKRPAQ